MLTELLCFQITAGKEARRGQVWRACRSWNRSAPSNPFVWKLHFQILPEWPGKSAEAHSSPAEKSSIAANEGARVTQNRDAFFVGLPRHRLPENHDIYNWLYTLRTIHPILITFWEQKVTTNSFQAQKIRIIWIKRKIWLVQIGKFCGHPVCCFMVSARSKTSWPFYGLKNCVQVLVPCVSTDEAVGFLCGENWMEWNTLGTCVDIPSKMHKQVGEIEFD